MTDARGHCPRCGRFCSGIIGRGSDIRGLFSVVGVCRRHGPVILTDQDWSWEDFFGDEAKDPAA